MNNMLYPKKGKTNPEAKVRKDGTGRGDGWLGKIKMKNRPDSDIVSENDIYVTIGGEYVLLPTIVPTLDADEVDYIANGGCVYERRTIIDKAVLHAINRIKSGKSPFADKNDKNKAGN